ncbi:M28 family metallopeptidase [Microbulbifer hydrolyticus]|uniref:Zn-dependent M28 family amino/carboxypeptidase n=2 Tax=Microbulbifer hydrolyticus TaxID=48074 RepID=A0AA89PV64_9GAMM|nr:M28 family metallopeptidase [Microbulbifer hydrolyticus]MBB5211827.1 Zn-dependent M28 family amino/carboxypeptidase [Microbulbifer hydrolyticus]
MRIKRFTGRAIAAGFLTALISAGITSCTSIAGLLPIPRADMGKLRADVEYLSADTLAGRQTGSPGYQQAAEYVAARFAALGLQSITGNDYFQPVPFREASWGTQRATLMLHGRDGDIAFELGEDFLASPPTIGEDTATSAGLVFVGYGIEAPEYGVDDYAELDVQGKIVVVVDGRPAQMPNEVGAHYASGRTKRDTAARHGAVGFISLNTPAREARRPFARSAAHLNDPSFDWLRADDIPGNAIPGLHPGVVLDMPAAKQLFMGAARSLDTVYTEMKSGVVPKGFPLPYSATLTSSAEHRKIVSPNVVGMLPGSDPKLKDEYVIFSAHLDHIGVSEGEHSEQTGADAHDRINNGAQDNAAGIAVMLEVARLFAESGRAPRRSVLFVAVTAEEEGLLGSDYFAQHPPVSPKSMVANINLDMPMLLYPFRDVIAFGAEHSSLGKTAEHAAERAGLKLSPDPMPEQVIFVRSDHYSFVRQGVPAIYLISGREAVDQSINGTDAQVEFLRTRYHRPSDEADEQINYTAARQFAEVNYAIAREITDADRKPRWNRGDFFGDLYSVD